MDEMQSTPVTEQPIAPEPVPAPEPTLREKLEALRYPKPMAFDVTQRSYYRIVTALRGPDVNPDSGDARSAKMMLTAVLRWFVGVHDGVGATVENPAWTVHAWQDYFDDTERAGVRDYLMRNRHFWRHASAAFEELAYGDVGPEVPGAKLYYEFLRKEMLLIS